MSASGTGDREVVLTQTWAGVDANRALCEYGDRGLQREAEVAAFLCF